MMYIAAQSENQSQTEAHSCRIFHVLNICIIFPNLLVFCIYIMDYCIVAHKTCLCENEKPTTSKNKRKDSHASSQTGTNADTVS